MKLFNLKAECTAIVSMAVESHNKNKKYASEISEYLIATLDLSYFHYDPVKDGVARLLHIAKTRGVIISYDELLTDPGFSEEFREILSEVQERPVKTMERAEYLVQILDKYRKARSLYNSAKYVIETLKGNSVDVEHLLDEVSETITDARVSREQRQIHILGRDDNATDLLLQSALYADAPFLLKTGYEEYDVRNGGLIGEGVVLLAGTTSGGKSVLRMNLLTNLYRLNKIDVGTISLEMNKEKETWRLLSSLTQIPYWKFVQQRLSVNEKAECKQALHKFKRFGERNNCRYVMYCPDESLTMSRALMIMKPYALKVLAIDYISLLEGVDVDQQAKAMKSAVREAKIFSNRNRCLVIILVQLDSDEDRIRYSRGMLEDADVCLSFNYSKPEDRERKLIPVSQSKGRDQGIMEFELKETFETMTIDNPDDIEQRLKATEHHRGGGGNTGGNGSASGRSNVNPVDSDLEINYVVE
jgi:replicative DNA helicase